MAKKPKLELGMPLEITWRDAAGGAGWVPIDEEAPNATVVSVGIFIREDSEGYILASGISLYQPEMLGASFIPKGMVKKIRRLK